jgi:hypothetical protein
VSLEPDVFTRCAAIARTHLSDAPEKRIADAALYLAHIEGAASLRRLASLSGKAANTVQRAVRKVEALRDDPLIDMALDAAGAAARRTIAAEACPSQDAEASRAEDPTEGAYLRRVAARVLERMSEPEAFMMVARNAEKAGVFCRLNRFRKPVALMTVEIAAALAARDWVACVSRTEASAKYAITQAGRAWLKREAAAVRAEQPFAAQHRVAGRRTVMRADGTAETIRVNLRESPLAWLATRTGPDGAPFLTREEVEAGERLRADFEAAQMGAAIAMDWRNLLTPRAQGCRAPSGPAEGPGFARDRVSAAVRALGPGLADAALRTCCHLEGLETVERAMGWSARSGKVVLKIALQRLAIHYGLTVIG